jgi:predicted transport protein
LSDIKLFRVSADVATEIRAVGSDLERPLQTLIERNLEALLGIRALKSEYSTGKTHAGRIDTLGFDENNCPVILEYKRSTSENVINQGLFYLDWLMDHRAEFKFLVIDEFDSARADLIDWSAPRLICIAADFTRYDQHAVQQMNRSIELIRYRKFGDDLLLLELVNAVNPKDPGKGPHPVKKRTTGDKVPRTQGDKTVAEWLIDAPVASMELFKSTEDYILSLGDDVQRKDLKLYIAFKRLRNFATVEIRRDKLMVFLRLDPDAISLTPGFTRDVRNIGHWGTGDVEMTIKDHKDFERAKALLLLAYEGGPTPALPS